MTIKRNGGHTELESKRRRKDSQQYNSFHCGVLKFEIFFCRLFIYCICVKRPLKLAVLCINCHKKISKYFFLIMIFSVPLF